MTKIIIFFNELSIARIRALNGLNIIMENNTMHIAWKLQITKLMERVLLFLKKKAYCLGKILEWLSALGILALCNDSKAFLFSVLLLSIIFPLLKSTLWS